MNLNSVCKILALALVLASGFASAQSADDDRRNFWFLNDTGTEIVQAYVSPHNSPDWGDDWLADDQVVENTAGTLFVFSSYVPPNICFFDFRLVLATGDVQEYTHGMNLCKYRAVQFNDHTLTWF